MAVNLIFLSISYQTTRNTNTKLSRIYFDISLGNFDLITLTKTELSEFVYYSDL